MGATFIQANGAGFGQSTSTRTVAFGSNVSAGNLLIVFADWFTGGSITISDTLGNQYTQLGAVQVGADGTTGAYYFAISKASGANTVSLNPNGNNLYTGLAIAEYNSSTGVWYFDGFASSTTNLSTTMDSGPIGINFANDLVVGAFGQANTITYTQGAGFNLRVNQPVGTTQMSVFLQDQLSAPGPSLNSTGTTNIAVISVNFGVSFSINPIVQSPAFTVTPPRPGGPLFRLQPAPALSVAPSVPLAAPVPSQAPPFTIGPPQPGTPWFKRFVVGQWRQAPTAPGLITTPPFTIGPNPRSPYYKHIGQARQLTTAASQARPQLVALPGFTKGPPRPGTPWFRLTPAPLSPPPSPPTPPINPPVLPTKSTNRPFVQRDPTQEQPLRRFTEIVATILNSLLGQGLIKQTGPESYTILGGGGGVLSVNGRSGAVTITAADVLAPLAGVANSDVLVGPGPTFRKLTSADLPPFPSPPLNNFSIDTVTDPQSTDDITEGYSVGSLWYSLAGLTMWVCLDNTAGGAAWAPAQPQVAGNALLVSNNGQFSETQAYDQVNDNFVFSNAAGTARLPDFGGTPFGSAAGSFTDFSAAYYCAFGVFGFAGQFAGPGGLVTLGTATFSLDMNGPVRYNALGGTGIASSILSHDQFGDGSCSDLNAGTAGNVLTSITTGGGTVWASQAFTATAHTFTAAPQIIVADQDSHLGLVVRGHSLSQTANLQEWQNSTPFAISAVNAKGEFTSPNPPTGSGVSNERFGASAGSSLTTGDHNAAFGAFALPACTIGTYNMAVGYASLLSCVDGSFNLAIGGLALPTMVSATGNVALGFSAGFSCSSGISNIFMGTQAGYYLSSGSFNMNIGVNAGLGSPGATTGNSNINIGYTCAFAITSGYQNINLGTQAGYAQTTGHDNICIGYLSGYTGTGANANVTGNQNTWIGSYAGPASTTQVSGTIALGYNAIVGVSNTGVLGGTGTDAVRMGVAAGSSSQYAKIGGGLFVHYANAGNTTTTETDLYSDSVIANTLSANGDRLRIKYAGIFVSSATATRKLKVYFAGIVILDTGALATTAAAIWDVSILLIRSTSSGARAVVTITVDGVTVSQPGAVVDEATLTGIDYTAANILKITGTAAGAGAATNDIVAKLGDVVWRPAP